jgi:hypothetical protein
MPIRYGIIIDEVPSAKDETLKGYEVYSYAPMSNITQRKIHEAVQVSNHFVLTIKTAFFFPYKEHIEIFDVVHECEDAETRLYAQAKRTAEIMQIKKSDHDFVPRIIDRTSKAKESKLSELVKTD